MDIFKTYKKLTTYLIMVSAAGFVIFFTASSLRPHAYSPGLNNFRADTITAGWSVDSSIINPAIGAGGTMWNNPLSPTFFLVGGFAQNFTRNYVNKFNLVTKTWTVGSPMPVAVWNINAVTLGDSLYIAGGCTGGALIGGFVGRPLRDLQMYDINADQWFLKTPLPDSAGLNRLISYQDSLIYSIGGITASQMVATDHIFLYNVFTNSWRAATSLPAANCGFGCALSGDTIVVVAGGTGYNIGKTNAVWRGIISQSNRSQITWIAGTVYPGTSRQLIGAASWGNKGIVAGPGSTMANISGWQVTNECYIYFNDTWTALPNTPFGTSGAGHASAKFGNVNVYIVSSGFQLTGNNVNHKTQIYSDSLLIIGIQNYNNEIPDKYILEQNFPNPFNPTTKIKFEIPKLKSLKAGETNSKTEIRVFDALGREVATLINETLQPGSYEVTFDASLPARTGGRNGHERNLTSGVYFYSLFIDGKIIDSKKMLLLR